MESTINDIKEPEMESNIAITNEAEEKASISGASDYLDVSVAPDEDKMESLESDVSNILDQEMEYREGIAKNAAVAEFIDILKDTGHKDLKGIVEVMNYFSGVEQQLHMVTQELHEVSQELRDMKALMGQNSPEIVERQSILYKMTEKVTAAKERLAEIKGNIVTMCKDKVNEFKERGVVALNDLSKFFNVKNALANLHKGVASISDSLNRSVGKMEALEQKSQEIIKKSPSMADRLNQAAQKAGQINEKAAQKPKVPTKAHAQEI